MLQSLLKFTPVTTKVPPTVAFFVTAKPVPESLLNVSVPDISAAAFMSTAPSSRCACYS